MFASFVLRGPSMYENKYNIEQYNSDDKKKTLSPEFKAKCQAIWDRYSKISGMAALTMLLPITSSVVLLRSVPLVGAALLAASVAITLFTTYRYVQAHYQTLRWGSQNELIAVQAPEAPIETNCKKYHQALEISTDNLYTDLVQFFKNNPLNQVHEATIGNMQVSRNLVSPASIIKLNSFREYFMCIKRSFESYKQKIFHHEILLEKDVQLRNHTISAHAQRVVLFCENQRDLAGLYAKQLEKLQHTGPKGEHLVAKITGKINKLIPEAGLKYLEKCCVDFQLSEKIKTEEWVKNEKVSLEANKKNYLNTIKKYVEDLRAAFAAGDGKNLEKGQIQGFEYKPSVTPTMELTIGEEASVGITNAILEKFKPRSANEP